MEPAVFIALAVILFFAVWGFKDGVVKRLIEVVGAVLTVILTARFAARVTPAVAQKTGWSDEIVLVVTWVGLIFVGMVLSRVLARLISKAVRLTVLGWVDRLGGATCGAAVGTIVSSVVLVVIGALPGGAEVQAAYRKDPVGSFIIDTAPNLGSQARLLAGDDFDRLWGKVTRSADEAADEAAAEAKRKLDEGKRAAEKAAQEAARLLEWDRVVDQIARRCVNGRAAVAVRRRRPFAEPAAIALHRELGDELRPLGDVNQWPPLAEVSGLLELLEKSAPLRLDGPDLVTVAGAAEDLDHLRDHLLELRARCPRWGEAAAQASTFSGLSGAIRRCLDPDGRIVDGASPLLARLRRAAAGQERAVRDAVNSAMTEAKREGWTTAAEATMRGDRFCLPLRSGDSRRIAGIVHDRSQTGATLFVEPAGVVSLANELTETRLEVAAEEARILFELNRAVERAAAALAEAAALMLEVDAARAHLLWSKAVGGQRVEIAEGAALRVAGGRHPLLLEVLGDGDLAAGRAAVVPLELEMPAGARALVVSGPNAGGKSVALKTVGVFCLLAQCGWDVPAREDTRLPLVGRVLADLGDDQSIAESLSSFSAHLRHLARFLREAGPDTLVLCDEIGSGTDPHEGTALAFGVLEDLAGQGALVLASTHFGLLKAAVHDHPLMVNAAMDYDDRDLKPLFTFRVGDPGTSHAFDIAARMGLPADLLVRARAMAGEERVQVEKLLADLDRRARELADAELRTRVAASEQELLNKQLGERLAGIDKERKAEVTRVRQEGQRAVADGRRALEAAIREVRTRGADQPSVVTARDRLAELEAKVQVEEERRAAADWTPEVGTKVRIPHLNLAGVVLEVRGQKLVADADGLRLTLGLDAVRPADASTPDPTARGDAPRPVDAGSWSWQGEAPEVSPEIDLRGERADEGWERLDRLIDRAIPAGLKSIHVIHGFGTGRLREFLYERMKADPRVASFREAPPSQGGGGATQVTLAG